MVRVDIQRLLPNELGKRTKPIVAALVPEQRADSVRQLFRVVPIDWLLPEFEGWRDQVGGPHAVESLDFVRRGETSVDALFQPTLGAQHVGPRQVQVGGGQRVVDERQSLLEK